MRRRLFLAGLPVLAATPDLTVEELRLALAMITTGGAAVIGKDVSGLAIGTEASFVVLDAANAAAAVAGVPNERFVVRRGDFETAARSA